MRKLLSALLLTVSAAAIASAQTPAPSTNHEIDTAWTAPASTLPACSTTVTTGCAKDLVQTITPPGGLAAVAPITIPWGQTSHVWAPGGALYCGTWGISLLAEYLDNAGALQKSAAITKTVNVTAGCPIPADPASGLVVTAK